jgi:autotransporter-associated beta strand protein
MKRTKVVKRFAATKLITKALALILVLVSFGLANSAEAASATWNANSDGSWNDDTKWNPASAPGSTSSTTNTDTATFGNIITVARIVTVDANRNIFGIDFSSAATNAGYTLSGGSILLTNGGFIQTSGTGNRIDNVNSPITIEGDGGTASFTANSTNNSASLRIGGTVTGVSTAGNTTTLTLNGTGTATTNQISGQISDGANGGKLSLTKSGAGIWQLASGTANSYTGKTTVTNGTLILAKGAGITAISSTGSSGSSAANTDLQVTGGTVQWGSRDQIVNTAKVGLSGGTLALNGFIEGTRSTVGVGSLTLSANSIIDLASTSLIHFADSSGQTWSGTLSIYNWSGTSTTGGGTEAILFGTNTSGLTQQQLDSVQFYSGSGTGAFPMGAVILSDGEIVPAPEPSTWIGGSLALGAIWFTQRRRIRVLIARRA